MKSLLIILTAALLLMTTFASAGCGGNPSTPTSPPVTIIGGGYYASPTATSTLTPTPTATPTPSIAEGIDPETGTYGNYYLGLVREPTGVQADSYGNLTVLINNRNAQNPTYSQLLDFLSSDKTDLYPFQGTLAPIPPRYGSLESYVDLRYWKGIVDGTIKPNPPRVCADYAEMLHNNSEMAGIRCAYVSVGLNSPIYDHALNAFETTDRGLVYIDDTGTDGSHNVEKVVDVQIGKSYVPQSLFPTAGWNSTWDSSGTVTDIFMTWDGSWNSRSGNSS